MKDKIVAMALMEYIIETHKVVVDKVDKDTDYMRGFCAGIEFVIKDVQKVLDVLGEKNGSDL